MRRRASVGSRPNLAAQPILRFTPPVAVTETPGYVRSTVVTRMIGPDPALARLFAIGRIRPMQGQSVVWRSMRP